MWFLFFEIWVWLLIAFALGCWVQWFLCCRGKHRSEDSDSARLVDSNESSTVQENWKPQGLASRPESIDDLKRIKGIGSVIEETLNDLGIYQFDQIAQWTTENVAWIENFLAFPGRIAREAWITQAGTLRDGGVTDFANRVDQGDIDYT